MRELSDAKEIRSLSDERLEALREYCAAEGITGGLHLLAVLEQARRRHPAPRARRRSKSPDPA